ncbi:DHS-like NAD/FAD-binding domain-containing protein, partial [Mycena floridula]
SGAGISVASGLSTFRDSNGKHQTKDYFDRHLVNNHDDIRKKSWQMLYDMQQKSRDALPSAFHEMMLSVYRQGRLLRVYTQNIDGLEAKVGLTEDCCIQLHGSLQRLRCRNGHTFPATNFPSLSATTLPSCPECARPDPVRRNPRPRRKHNPVLLDYDIVMYGDQSRDAAELGAMLSADLADTDLLVIVGTSLSTPTGKAL